MITVSGLGGWTSGRGFALVGGFGLWVFGVFGGFGVPFGNFWCLPGF